MTAEAERGAFLRTVPLWRDLVADMHPERWRSAGLGPEAAKRLSGCARSRWSLSRDLSWFGVEQGHWPPTGTPDGPAIGRALLPGGELWRKGLCFGAGWCRSEISGLVLRSDVQALKSAVGADAYDFALRRAPLVLRGGALSGMPLSGPLVGRIERTAGLALGCWLASLPDGVRERAALKLPPACDAAVAEAGEWPEELRGQWLAQLDRMWDFA